MSRSWSARSRAQRDPHERRSHLAGDTTGGHAAELDALAEHVRTILAGDPTSGHLFVFRNRSSQRMKILWWDSDGYAIYYKRLERGMFQFPTTGGKSVTIVTGCPNYDISDFQSAVYGDDAKNK